jgi:dual specificity tyrosine-phosphorylation-regulated kinase 2/3/4
MRFGERQRDYITLDFYLFCSNDSDGLISINIAEALRLYGSRLTAYERLEIEHYPEIWFLGLDARKIHGEEGAPQNGGYDDENGSYHKVNG